MRKIKVLLGTVALVSLLGFSSFAAITTTPKGVQKLDSADIVDALNNNADVLDEHIDKIATTDILGHIKIGTGLQVSEDGTASVKIANDLKTDDAETALSAAMGVELSKELYDTLNPEEFQECVNFSQIVGSEPNITSCNGIFYPDIEDKTVTITACEVLGVVGLSEEQLAKLTIRKYDRGFIITSYDVPLSKTLANTSCLFTIKVN